MKKFFALYIPTTTAVNIAASPELINQYRVKVAATLAGIAGGATEIEGHGSWVSDAHGLVTEKVYIVKAYYKRMSKADKAVIGGLAKELREAFLQEAISLETEKGLRFV